MLSDTMAALQTIADAVTNNDGRAYLNAVHKAREFGCSEDQIRDAYNYRVSVGARPTFNPDGSLNYERRQCNRIAGADTYAIKIEGRNIDGEAGSGVTTTKWLTISADKFQRIADILAE